LIEGKMQSTGLNYFRAKQTKFWTLKPEIATTAKMCARCGFIIWLGDVARLAALRKNAAAKAAKDSSVNQESK
jgi:hypothetical protein